MYFVKNPINRAVQISPRSDATFHRVIATVSVGGRTYEQSYPVSVNTTQAFFDLSSSIRAYTDSIQDVSAGNYFVCAPISFSVSFHEEYMKNGTLHKLDVAGGFSGEACLGGYTDRERISGSVADNSAESASFTLRPSSPMIVPSGRSFLMYRRDGLTRMAKMSNQLTQQEFRYYIGDPVYNVDDSPHWYEFQFVNSRGLHESAFACCYSTESIKGGNQTHVRSLRETFSRISRRLNINDPSVPTLSFSSGFVDPAWAKWWAYEFCRANKHQRHWILLDGLWVPCSVQLKDGTAIVNRSKTEMLSVEFDVIPDVYGMI